MRLKRTLMIITALFVAFTVSGIAAQARFMRTPDIHKDKVVFSYAGDIWTAGLDGSPARQLTTDEGMERYPKFSPDGKWIAYVGQYNGYQQVFVIPVDGGTPKQLTYAPLFRTLIVDWSQDGKYVLYANPQKDHFFRAQVFKVPVNGGWPEQFPLSEAINLSFSPDGKKVAFNRNFRELRTWKRYTGGRQQDIWIYDIKKDSLEKITDWKGTDRFPMWHGDSIYFISDETGKMNLYKINPVTKDKKPVTQFKEWDIRYPSAGPEAIVFEKGGKLFRTLFNGDKTEEIKVDISFDKSHLRPKYINTAHLLESYSLPNGGNRFVVGARGEIFTVPKEKGNVRNLTNSPGVNEKAVDWSPDGKWISLLGDYGNNHEIYIMDQFGKNRKQLTKDTDSIIVGYLWSPDSKKIAYGTQDGDLFTIDVESGDIEKIDSFDTGPIGSADWSPDSKWLVYTRADKNEFGSLWVYNVDKKETKRLTSDFTNDRSARFSPDGKHIFFVSSRDFTPRLSNVEFNWIHPHTDRVYMMTLQKATDSPFAPESDEVKVDGGDKKKAPPKKNGGDVKVAIDFENIEARTLALPVSPAKVSGLVVANGLVLYTKDVSALNFTLTGDGGSGATLYGYDIAKKKEIPLLSGIKRYTLSPDKKMILWTTRSHYGISPVSPAPIKPQSGKVKQTLRLETLMNPILEWKQLLKETWRLQKYNFYVKNMHGLDWDAVLSRYLLLVPYLSHRDDARYLIGEMIAELNTSHTYVFNLGDTGPRVANNAIGTLGCDFAPDKNGYYKITKIFRGENWSNGSKSPLTLPGVKASEGDYILAINGKTLKQPASPYKLLEKTAGKIVTLKLNNKPVEKGAWTVEVVPVRSDFNLRYNEWVLNNREIVNKATDGKVGYVHIPDCMFEGLNAFVRQYTAQLDKEALIIDGRNNGGGFAADLIIERLMQKVLARNATRHFGLVNRPRTAFPGPMIMLTDKNAGSDGDYLPYYFQLLKIGPVIGTRTWGGIVGIFGGTGLMDGSYISMPTTTSFTKEGKWNPLEGHGIDPDIVVDNMPNDEFKGKDAQLDKGIEVALDLLKKAKKLPGRPADPVKTK